MYIKRIKIENIRSIRQFEMTFDQPDGWHVLIGDNGAGKSAIIKSVALALLDTNNMSGITFDWDDWLSRQTLEGSIELTIQPVGQFEGDYENLTNKLVFDRVEDLDYPVAKIKEFIYRDKEVVRTEDQSIVTTTSSMPPPDTTPTPTSRVLKQDIWFSAAYGPLRRFRGGDQFQEEELYKRYPKLGAHLTVFKEDFALSQADKYIRDLFVSGKADGNPAAGWAISGIRDFFNYTDLLPHGTTLGRITSRELFFNDASGNQVKLSEMSDGYRSILSLMFELIRQLIFSYGVQAVFENVNRSEPVINLPGVVLIDEIDAHLHPTWQTRIGQWFTKYFPAIQFIVTTHSPLICRAAERGSIWQLPAPGTNETVQKIIGDEKNQLVFGNVLEQYGTGAFGKQVARSDDGQVLLKELAELNTKFSFGKLTEGEQDRMKSLRKIFTTDDTTEF